MQICMDLSELQKQLVQPWRSLLVFLSEKTRVTGLILINQNDQLHWLNPANKGRSGIRVSHQGGSMTLSFYAGIVLENTFLNELAAHYNMIRNF